MKKNLAYQVLDNNMEPFVRYDKENIYLYSNPWEALRNAPVGGVGADWFPPRYFRGSPAGTKIRRLDGGYYLASGLDNREELTLERVIQESLNILTAAGGRLGPAKILDVENMFPERFTDRRPKTFVSTTMGAMEQLCSIASKQKIILPGNCARAITTGRRVSVFDTRDTLPPKTTPSSKIYSFGDGTIVSSRGTEAEVHLHAANCCVQSSGDKAVIVSCGPMADISATGEATHVIARGQGGRVYMAGRNSIVEAIEGTVISFMGYDMRGTATGPVTACIGEGGFPPGTYYLKINSKGAVIAMV